MQSRPQFRPHSALSRILLYQRTVRKIKFSFSSSHFFFIFQECTQSPASAASCCVYVPHQKDRLFSRTGRLLWFFPPLKAAAAEGDICRLTSSFFFFCDGYRKRFSNSTPSPLPSPLVHSPNYSGGMEPGLGSCVQCPGVSPGS